jgi:hypothetical protein
MNCLNYLKSKAIAFGFITVPKTDDLIVVKVGVDEKNDIVVLSRAINSEFNFIDYKLCGLHNFVSVFATLMCVHMILAVFFYSK